MPALRGKAEVSRFIAQLPEQIERKLLPGAAKAAAMVVKEEAKERVTSDAVAANIVTRSKREPGRVEVKITVKRGWALSLGNWLEWGTSPHFITVDHAATGGMTAGRVNRLDRAAAQEGRAGPGASLVINGKFVGPTVFHPGSRKEPFLRPALDTKQDEAIRAAQAYINARVKPSGIVATSEPEDDE